MPVREDGIDFVLAWVDGNDPEWQERKKKLTGNSYTDDTIERYRDWGLLRYWFRGVEKFAPWVRKVFFICDQEPPEWLNQNCSRLQIVRHEDYLPAEYRPAFSSHPIELNMHRIPGLSERFVYFNDDMFLLSDVKEETFFKNGLPRDSALMNPVPTTGLRGKDGQGRIFTIPLNNVEYLNRDYDFWKCVKAHPLKWINLRYGKGCLRNLIFLAWNRFVGFDELHLPQAFMKSSFYDAWKQYGDIMEETSKHTFRDDRDINQWLIRNCQLAKGNFMPRSPGVGGYFDLNVDSADVIDTVLHQKKSMICINDGRMEEDQFLQIRDHVKMAFEHILPDFSEFETEGSVQE